MYRTPMNFNMSVRQQTQARSESTLHSLAVSYGNYGLFVWYTAVCSVRDDFITGETFLLFKSDNTNNHIVLPYN